MLTDQFHVAVRPRGILECLDLAVVFCGRRPVAVAVATMLGAIPCILLNRLVVGDTEAGPVAAYVLLGLEAAWASVPLTLYLGQAVFSERFSWRFAVRAFSASLPALVVFQGLLRGICLMICFLAPVVFVGMYYLDQVILLEQPGFARIWGRRSAINKRNSAHVCSLVLIDAAILVVGVPLGTRFLGAVSALWQGRPVSWLAPDEAGGFLGAAVFSWHGQIAFWSACGLLTVFRFFTYLDARIRREGWDVELKFRADATYVGLSAAPVPDRRPASPSRLAAVAGGMLLVFILNGVAAAAAEPTGTSTGGDGARRALARQSFPWYDASEDRYRPLIRPAGEGAGESAEERSREAAVGGDRPDSGGDSGSGSGRGLGGGGGSARSAPPRLPSIQMPTFALGGLGWILMVALIVAGVLAIVYVWVRFGLGKVEGSEAENDTDAAMTDLDEERLAALPAGARLTGSDLLDRAASHAEQGEFERAILFFHAWQLLELDRRGGLTLARGKTNGQYAGEVAAATPALAVVFRRSSRLFEDAFFGDLPVAKPDFLAVWNERERIRAAGPTTGG